MQVLAMTTRAYRIQSRSIILNSLSNKEIGSSSADIGKVHLNSVVALFESQWSTLQMVVLREILLSYVRAGDPIVVRCSSPSTTILLLSHHPCWT
ncbi:hypothetical protein GIB67_020354 [Kingdonia uniflora]|uniref:Uncharacterized protein n=1 Tax=Kingdonia uniflora TaxID=39325 RepID=A0A7J7LR89_9MAGN|nr:hypothetical protein GIB67_020354 [Kingdonia uniflora]